MRTGIKIALIIAAAIMASIVAGIILSARNMAIDIVTP
jgi:hypothetical protein